MLFFAGKRVAALMAKPKSTHPLRRLENVEGFLQSIDTFIFDLDGVVWHGDVLIPGAVEVILQLRKLGKRIFYISNNSTKSRSTYLQKFKQLGLPATEEEVFPASFAAALYLSSIGFKKKVYLIGQDGIKQELAHVGIECCGGEAEKEYKAMEEIAADPLDPDIGAVVVGFDRYLNYTKLAKAHILLRNSECLFIATNTDRTFPSSAGHFPGGGTMVNAVEYVSGRKPTVVGKPSQTLLDLIVSQYGLDRSRTCMVGDRLETDILFGLHGGLQTLLVLTGVTTEAELRSPHNDIIPTFYTNSVADLLLPKQTQ